MPWRADPGAVIVKLAHEKDTSRAVSRPFFDTFGDDGIWNERPEFVSRLFTHWKGKKKKVLKNLEKISGKKSIPNFIETPTETIKCWKISYRLYILKPICVSLLILLYQPDISKQRASAWKREYRSAQQTLHFFIHKCSFVALLIFVHLIIKMKKKWK
jgi:hypothetical protein